MPEILTKYPEIVIKILQDEGIKCSRGEQQKILVTCPKDHFCSLKTGELCIYGVEQFSQMTQIKKEDLFPSEQIGKSTIGYFLCFFGGILVGFLFFRKRKHL